MASGGMRVVKGKWSRRGMNYLLGIKVETTSKFGGSGGYWFQVLSGGCANFEEGATYAF